MATLTGVKQISGVDWYETAGDENKSWRLSLVTYGKCVYWVNGDKQIMEKGELLLIPAGVPYYGKSIPTLTHTQVVIEWSEEAEAGLSVIDREEAVKHKPGCYELIQERLKIIQQQWQERPSYYVKMIEALLTEVLIYISRELDRGKIAPDKHLHVERMKSYIDRHYREKITKEELGDAVGITPNYAAALFKSVTGQTISQYVHAQRMKRAAYLLTESQLTIQEIATFLGYQDISYFYRVYKRITGSAPSDLLHERPRTV